MQHDHSETLLPCRIDIPAGWFTARDANVLIFLKNDRFVMKTTTKNQKRNDRF